MEDDLEILKVEYQSNNRSDMSLKLRGPIGNGKLLAMKKTSKGRQPQHPIKDDLKMLKNYTSLQPVIVFFSNVKLKIWAQNQNRKLLEI